VRRTYRRLARQLAELDVDPEPETEQLVAGGADGGGMQVAGDDLQFPPHRPSSIPVRRAHRRFYLSALV
jgi:hypothetical protein